MKSLRIANTGEREAAKAINQSEGWFRQMTEEAQTRITLPQGFVVAFALYLIAQLVGSIWWAATLSANVANLTTTITSDRNEQKLKVQQLENNQQNLSNEFQQLKITLGILEGKKK